MIKMSFDLTLFNTGMIKLRGAAIEGSCAGVTRAIERLKDDALNKYPACPYDTGWMSEHHQTRVYTRRNTTYGVLAVVDTPYAASLHEGISRWGTPYRYKTPGTGMKWIESKVLMYRNIYVEDMRQEIKTRIKARFMRK